MTKASKVIIGVLAVAVILMGIGYAALTNTTLNIAGTLSAEATQSDFKVVFTDAITSKATPVEERTEENPITITASKTDDTNAVFSVTGLQVKGDIAEATYTIQNTSTGIKATNIVAEVTAGTNAYFETTVSEPSKTALEPGETATVTVTTELLKTPLSAQNLSVGVTITADPEESTVTE